MKAKRNATLIMNLFGSDPLYMTPRDRQEVNRLENDTSHEPIVYYMRMDRLVKIGWSTNLRTRVETIGPQGVLAVEYGARAVERRRHKQFVNDHSHLEWFWLRDALAAHIVEARQNFEAAAGMTTEEWLDLHGVRSSAIGAST